MKEKEQYTLEELFRHLPITVTELSKLAGMSEVTIRRIRHGYPARRSTANKLLLAFSKAYERDLSVDNVAGVTIDERQSVLPPVKTAKQVTEKPPKRAYTHRKVTGLPEGSMLATDFAKAHGVEPRTFYDHMIIGLGRGAVPGEIAHPALPVNEQVDYSERDKPGRKGERERYLTPAQQATALEFWRRHGIEFTIPE